MSYLTQTRIAANPNLILRAAACAAGEGVPDAQYWVQERMMQLAVSDGWARAFAESESEDPGTDEDAITDEMILERVRELIAAETSPELPEEEES